MRGMRPNNSRFLSTHNSYHGGANAYQNPSSSTHHNQAGRMQGRNPSVQVHVAPPPP